MSLHPSAHPRTVRCRASIHPSEPDWRVLALHLWFLVEVWFLSAGSLVEDSFMPIAMSRLLPFPGSCLGKQQKKRLCCPGILSAVSCLSLPQPRHPGLRTAAACSTMTFINRGGFEKRQAAPAKASRCNSVSSHQPV